MAEKMKTPAWDRASALERDTATKAVEKKMAKYKAAAAAKKAAKAPAVAKAASPKTLYERLFEGEDVAAEPQGGYYKKGK